MGKETNVRFITSHLKADIAAVVILVLMWGIVVFRASSKLEVALFTVPAFIIAVYVAYRTWSYFMVGASQKPKAETDMGQTKINLASQFLFYLSMLSLTAALLMSFIGEAELKLWHWFVISVFYFVLVPSFFNRFTKRSYEALNKKTDDI